MSKSAVVKSVNLPAQPIEDQAFKLTSPAVGTPAWKQEVNQRLAAHRTRRGGPQEEADQSADDSPRSASSRAAEAAARVAARYAKAPSYKQLLAGEARAVVRAAGAAAEAARNAQAAAQAVLTGLEFGPHPATPWEPQVSQTQSQPAPQIAEQARKLPAQPPTAAPPRWQDQPPAEPLTAAELAWREYEAIHGPQHFPPVAQPSGAKARWEEDLPVSPTHNAGRDEWADMRLHPSPQEREQYGYGASPLAVGFSNSHDPIGEATVQPVQPIAANLIEFPKELIAARKARPRLAEGPYYDAAKESPQLNIFEVDPDLLAPPIYLSDTHNDVAPPEWASIELNQRAQDEEGLNEPVAVLPWYAEARFQSNAQIVDSVSLQNNTDLENDANYQKFASDPSTGSVAGYTRQSVPNSIGVAQSVAEFAKVAVSSIVAAKASSVAVAAQVKDSKAAAWESIAKLASVKANVVESAPMAPLTVAPLRDRVLAALVDGALVTLAFLAAAMVVVASTSHPPTGRIALIASIFGLLLFGVLYQFLFFSFAEEGTPGMRYARIALCSFEDDNPCREQMRKRIPAMLLSALPVGLGFAWALIDGDNLALHDRLTRTYQRKY